jgi:sugar lactone lactonase YvrE
VPVVSTKRRDAIFYSFRTGVQSPWRVSLDGASEPTQIVNEFAAGNSLDVSPDGQRLLFQSSNDRNAPILVICDLPACSNRRELDLPGDAFAPTNIRRWMPDGERIAYVGPDGTNIWAVPLDGGPSHRVTNFSDGRTVVSFAWSHDGSQLAVLRGAITNDVVLIRGTQE